MVDPLTRMLVNVFIFQSILQLLTAIRVQMEGGKVNSRDVKGILPHIPSSTLLVRIASVSACQGPKAFIANSHHVVCVQGLDVL